MKLLIINGVNLSLLGSRETDVYGCTRFEDYLDSLRSQYPEVCLDYLQTDKVEEIAAAITGTKDVDGIILNPGAYTHTSIVIADAIKAVPVRVVEVHISNLFGREQFRRHSFIAPACAGSISGFGLKGYELALLSFIH
jgi:3-dehydroquinate dehydratase-2